VGGLLLLASAVVAFVVLSSDRPVGVAPEGMVWVPDGEFWMGSNSTDGDGKLLFPDTVPVHKVHVDGFWMDRTEVTNEQFARFAEATGYKTIAERVPDPKEHPDAKKELLVPFSAVFKPPADKTGQECRECGICDWWIPVPGANWRHPEGPDSTIKGREKHPVVHIAWDDAVAYAKWASKRLPTEAEWERAARGGLEQKKYYWGDERTPGGKWMANIWQGDFPVKNTAEDGFKGTAPVGSFPPNAYGIVDMAGNAWEWCSDWYQPDYYKFSPSDNPQGPKESIDPDGRDEPKRVMRGGSFLCSDQYCIRYMAGARHHGAPDTGLAHFGFRCAKSR
jgi:formylglycine-generating enzyme required for sulfatase activity